MAAWIPVTVVPTSAATVAIATFMTDAVEGHEELAAGKGQEDTTGYRSRLTRPRLAVHRCSPVPCRWSVHGELQRDDGRRGFPADSQRRPGGTDRHQPPWANRSQQTARVVLGQVRVMAFARHG